MPIQNVIEEPKRIKLQHVDLPVSLSKRSDVFVQHRVELLDVRFDDGCVGGVEEDGVAMFGGDVDEKVCA